MSTTANKQLMQTVFAALAHGDATPFADALADDVCWTLIGHTAWSRTYRGKREVRDQLTRPLFAQFADTYTAHAQRFIAEDDFVVVEFRGRVTTKTGQPYHNTYCWVCRLEDGRLREITEYMDTQLVTEVLGPPQAA